MEQSRSPLPVLDGASAVGTCLAESGLTRGVVPSGPCSFPQSRMCIVASAWDAVSMMHDDGGLPPGCFGGVSLSHVAPEHSLRDVLLGWVIHDVGFVWSTIHRFSHRGARRFPKTPRTPVWLTCCDDASHSALRASRRLRRMFMMRCREAAEVREAAIRRAAFWERSMREFIETTWHPSRAMQWCFDMDMKA